MTFTTATTGTISLRPSAECIAHTAAADADNNVVKNRRHAGALMYPTYYDQ